MNAVITEGGRSAEKVGNPCFKATRHFSQDLQSTSSYFLPIGEMAEGILKDLDEKIFLSLGQYKD